MDRRVKQLTVEGVQKRRFPNKNYVYIMKVLWSDGTINIVYRNSGHFFDLQERLLKEFPETHKLLPTLKALKITKQGKFRLKDGSCKRMTLTNKFCDELINSPDMMSLSYIVLDFCKPSTEDLNPQKSPCCSKTKAANEENKRKEKKEVENISGPIVFEQYIVIADYKKQSKNDINLKAGDIVDAIERNENGWWLVDHDGVLGWAPASYLEPVDDDSEIVSTQTFAPGKEEVYQSLRSYKAESDDELSFDVGVLIRISQKTLDGWWYGSYNGLEGWLPAMSLKKLDPTQPVWTPSAGQQAENVISNEGAHQDKSYSRRAPMRRSKVKKSIKRKPRLKENKPDHNHSTQTIPEEEEPKPGHNGQCSASMFNMFTFSKPDDFELSRRRKSATLLPLNLSSGGSWTPSPEASRSASTVSLPNMLDEHNESDVHDENQLSTNLNSDLEHQKITTPSSEQISSGPTIASLPEETVVLRPKPMPRSVSAISLSSMAHEQDRKILNEKRHSLSSGYDSGASNDSQQSLQISPDGNGYDMTDSYTGRRPSSASLTPPPQNFGARNSRPKNNSPLSLRKPQPKPRQSISPLLFNKSGNKSPLASSVPSSPVSPLQPFASEHLREHRKLSAPTLLSSYNPEASSGQRGRTFAVIMTEEEVQAYQSAQLSEHLTLHELPEDPIQAASPTGSISLSDDDSSVDSGRWSLPKQKTRKHSLGILTVNDKIRQQSQDWKSEDTNERERRRSDETEVFEQETTFDSKKVMVENILKDDLVSNNNEVNNDMPTMYRAFSAYTAEAVGEVSLVKGKMVEVRRQSDSGWWFVRAGGKEGWAPSNFLQPQN